MRAIEILTDEHCIIVRVLACLERLAGEAEAAGKLEADPARDVVWFLRTYADAIHHGKEEDLLFPKMVDRGESAEDGPIALLREDHEVGRRSVREMASALDAAAAGDAAALARFVREARSFAAFLRDHAQKEDEVVFPLAAEILSEDDGWELLEGYARFEAERDPADHERCLRIASELGRRFDVSETA